MKRTFTAIIATLALATPVAAMNFDKGPQNDARYKAELGELLTSERAENAVQRRAAAVWSNQSATTEQPNLARARQIEIQKAHDLYR